MKRPVGRLWWMYVAAAVLLVEAGAGSGQIAYMVAHQRLGATAIQCMTNHGVNLETIASSYFSVCLRSYHRGQALFAVLGILALMLTTLVLMVSTGLLLGSRFRRAAADPSSRAQLRAAERFEFWCDRAGLQGRIRPRLVLGRPGRFTRSACATSVLFRRPIVMIPLAYAYLLPEDEPEAQAHGSQFDFMVLHELAHIRSRDLPWAAMVWWSGWLNVPIFLLAFSPLLIAPQGYPRQAWDYPEVLRNAVVLSVITFALRAALLRRRELDADREAVAVLGSTDALARAAGLREEPCVAGNSDSEIVAPGKRTGINPRAVMRRMEGSLRAVFATHPQPAQRVERAGQPDSGWESSFLIAGVVGVLTMSVYQTVTGILGEVLSYNGLLNLQISTAVAGLLWAVLLVPIWSRSGGPGGRSVTAVRWLPLATSAGGLVLGWAVRTLGSYSPVSQAYSGYRVVTALCLALVGLGAGALAAVCADALAAARIRTGGRYGRWLTALAVIAAGLIMAAGIHMVLLLISVWEAGEQTGTGAELIRSMLTYPGSNWLDVALGASAAALLVLLSAGRTISQKFRCARGEIPVLAALAAVAALVVLTGKHVDGSGVSAYGNGVFSRSEQLWWVAGLSGALVTVLFRSAGRLLTSSVAVGAISAMAIGLVMLITLLITGQIHLKAQYFQDYTAGPLWLFLVVFVLAVPLVLATQSAARTWFSPRRFLPLRALAPGAALAVLVAAALVGSEVIGFVTTRAQDQGVLLAASDRLQAAQTQQEFAMPQPALASRAEVAPHQDAGRLLSPAAAKSVVRHVQGHLLSGWHDDGFQASGAADPGMTPLSCRRMYAQDAADDHKRPQSVDTVLVSSLSKTQRPPFGASASVEVTSYREPADALAVGQRYRHDIAGCPRWNEPNAEVDRGVVPSTIVDDGQLTVPLPGQFISGTWAVEKVVWTNGLSGVFGFVSANVVVGHNLVRVDVTDSYSGVQELPADRVAADRRWRDSLIADAVAELAR